jgi:hypothetical protein
VQAVQDLGSRGWHGLPPGPGWSLWTWYACAALYAHPAAWDEIGFSGPAYHCSYKNIGVDARVSRSRSGTRGPHRRSAASC